LKIPLPTRVRLLLVLMMFVASPGLAQSNDEINSAIQFNLSTPGARSLAMGGTFLALADDATAAYTNPAGLTHLLIGGAEASMEFRAWRFESDFVSGGRFSGSASRIGIDTTSDLTRSGIEQRTRGMSFASFGYVLPGGLAIAGFSHQAVDFKGALERQAIFFDASRIQPVRSRTSIDLGSTGLAAAYDFAFDEDERRGLSVGASFSYFDFRLSSLTERFGVADLTLDAERDRSTGGFYGPADFLLDNLHTRQTHEGDDDGWGVGLGLLWRVDRAERWSIGAVYRSGPDFDLLTGFQFGPAAGTDLDGTTVEILSGPAVFKTPSVWGIGVAFRPLENLRVAVDYDRVRYSLMSREIKNILLAAEDTTDFSISDANEVHVGGEYIVRLLDSGLTAAIRLGTWYETEHRLRYDGNDKRLQARFQPGEGELHAAAGFGLVVRESFQVDFGVDLSDSVQTTSLSIVWFF
jgi:long-chain fatty acid transport protein